MAKRKDRVAPPPLKEGWDFRYATGDAANGWEQVCSAAQYKAWAAVNTQLAKDLPYLFLDQTVSAWAASNSVRNWAFATAGDGSSVLLNPNGGSAMWAQIWK